MDATTGAAAAEFGPIARLREVFPETVLEVGEFRGEHTVVVPRERVTAVLTLMRDDPAAQFNLLADLTAVDWLPRRPRFDVVYHLKSLSLGHRLRVKTRVPQEDAVVETATIVWPGANWLEREVYDMFGITFRNHPDLRRILMPDEWQGHPLRKDFPTGKVEVNFDKTRGK